MISIIHIYSGIARVLCVSIPAFCPPVARRSEPVLCECRRAAIGSLQLQCRVLRQECVDRAPDALGNRAVSYLARLICRCLVERYAIVPHTLGVYSGAARWALGFNGHSSRVASGGA